MTSSVSSSVSSSPPGLVTMRALAWVLVVTCWPALTLGMMGDEYPVVAWEDIWEEGLEGLMMVESCRMDYVGLPVERLCKQQVTPEAYTYVLDLPVTSRATNTTYVNYHCAVCNDDARNLHTWNVTINCSTKQILKTYTLVEFMQKATYQPGLRKWQRFTYRSPEDEKRIIPDEFHVCYFDVLEFKKSDKFIKKYGGRLCIYPKGVCEKKPSSRTHICKQQVRHCDPAWPDQLDREKCRRYSQLFMHKNGTSHETVYKNPHCARCNFVNVSSSAVSCVHSLLSKKCVSNRSTGSGNLPTCFSVLMDFRENTCNTADELWDPIHLTCKKIYCGRLFKLENGECVKDYTAYQSLGNSTLLDNSCPKIELLEDDYVPRPDGSVFVNTTKKVYKKGEFEMHSETKILVCNDHYQYTAGFSEIHSLLTLIVLLISLAGLALHIIVYLLVPRFRNLPGKNLFCLSCCLFIAHLIFLTGMRTHIHELCVFISAALHYFWLASFCWMNVMSVDVCRTFTSQLYRGDTDARQSFIFYSIYAWTIPALVVTLSLVFDYTNVLPEYRPGYATDLCWLNNRYGLALFFLFPVGAIVLENTILFFVTACGIYKQVKAARYANRRSQSVKEGHGAQGAKNSKPGKMQKEGGFKQILQGRRSAKERVRLILYIKLGLIQGLSWITGFMAAFVDVPACWYPFTVLNGLQGAFIFLGFDMKRKSSRTCDILGQVGEAVWEALVGRPWRKHRSSKGTRTTTFGQSSSSQNQSSRSSSPQQAKIIKKLISQRSTNADSLRGVQTDPSSKSRVEGVRNGDLRAGVVKGKFDDESGGGGDVVRNQPQYGLDDDCCSSFKSPGQDSSKQQRSKPDLQRVVDLLQQLQLTNNSMDLPDLVQQLLLRSGGATDSGQSSLNLSKCKSFTEGTNPVVQEEQRKALTARLRLLEYSKECPTIHSLITSHAHTPPRETQQLPNKGTGISTITQNSDFYPSGLPVLSYHSPTQQHKELKALVNAVNNSHKTGLCSSLKHHQSQLFTDEEEFKKNQNKQDQTQGFTCPLQRTPKSQSFSQISQVALAAAIMQKAALDARERRQRGEEDGKREDGRKSLNTNLSKKGRASESLV
ncbi:G-protein coupled receptor Mth-like 10-like 2 [Homarus americanus]|uniref:G-protein coupled receptor Mth-like 10-like 2 n=1 Tax=Homarus americanus TaxID=6706 RepID=A0A8J5MNE4_HOMAM|nr:G-protein coupled receptor Mth-like 10-like 2 [Homarus americanus]